ncbi:MAG: hypothetical protein QM648_08760 [Solirubrobacterales bacterium]
MIRTLIAATALAVVLLAIGASAAQANVTFNSPTPTVSVSSNVPGAHASMTVSLDLGMSPGGTRTGDDVRRIISDIAPGFIGDPTAIAADKRCTITDPTQYGNCPASAKVGSVTASANACIWLFIQGPFGEGCSEGDLALDISGNIYQLKNGPNGLPTTSTSASGVPEVPTYLGISLTVSTPILGSLASPMGLTAKITIANKDDAPYGRSEDFAMRFETVEDAPRTATTSLGARPIRLNSLSLTFNALTADGTPFMTNPTRCTPWTTKFYARAYDSNTNANVDIDPTIAGNDYYSVSRTTTPNCSGALGTFDPNVTMQTFPSKTDAPAALRVIITNAEATTSGGLQSSHIKRMDMTMPDGFEINPMMANSIADSTKVCSYAQFNRSNPDATNTCPAESKLGTVKLDTPMMSQQLTGGLYLGPPGSTDSDRFKMFFALDDPNDVVKTKGEGRAYVDHDTGRITATLGDPAVDGGKSLPAFLWTRMQLDFKSGPNAMMTNPRSCGAHTGSVVFTPWMTPNQGTVTRTPSVSVSYDGAGAPCPEEPFAPSAAVSLSDTTAGAHADVTTTVKVPAHSQDLARTTMAMPAGMGAAIDSTDKCSQTDAAIGNCAESTKIGTVEVRVGNDEGDADDPGTNLVKITGSMYNTAVTWNDDPALRNPARFTAVVPAAVGPFDLGYVVVPVDITLNPDMSFNAVTPEVPTRMLGIPVRMRKLSFTLKAQVAGHPFMTNPTVCGTHDVTAKMWSTQHPAEADAVTTHASFDITGCPKNFSTANPPTFSFTPTNTEVGRPVGIRATLAMPAAYDPPASTVSVKMPEGMRINPALASGIDSCAPEEVDAGAHNCPESSRLGTVEFTTPLLSGTFYGKIWLVDQGSTPDQRYRIAFTVQLPGQLLVAHGETIVDGSSEVANGLGLQGGSGQITITFRNIPAVYFNSFTMIMESGSKAMLSNDYECGTSTAVATAWPQTTGGSPVTMASSYQTSWDGAGAPCPATREISPSMNVSIDNYAAGAAPNVNMHFHRPDKQQMPKHIKVTLPAGMAGTPSAAPQCAQAVADLGNCPDASKVGDFNVTVGLDDSNYTVAGGLFNTVPPADRPAKFTAIINVEIGPFDLGKMVLPIDVNLDPDTYRLVATTGEIPTMYEGVPVRANALDLNIHGIADQGTPSPVDDKAFLINPHRCDRPGVFEGDMDSHEGGAVHLTVTLPQNFTGCENLNLDGPGNDVRISNGVTTAFHPTPFTTQVLLGSGPTQATLESMSLELRGFRINAVAAGDAEVCSDQQLTAGTCPAASKIGESYLDTPLLDPDDSGHSLTGGVYLLTPGQAAADRYRVGIEFAGRTRIVLRGVAKVDETTGEITLEFDGLPDLPFSEVSVAVDGTTTPLLLNPAACDPASPVAAQLTGSNGSSHLFWPTVAVTDCQADPGFTPTPGVSLSTTQSGAHPDVSFTITRPADDQNVKSVKISLPAGFVGSAAAVPLCPISAAQAGTCPAASKVGVVTAHVGAAGQTDSEATLELDGEIFLTEGASGDIAGLAVRLPAVAGPYDLGVFTVLGRVTLRPDDHGIDTEFDGLPKLFKGIPTPIRSMDVKLFGTAPSTGKPFMYNASSCAEMSIASDFGSHEGADYAPDELPYQATGCDTRSFAPSMSFVASGGNVSSSPAWDILLRRPAEDSTIRDTVVTLPSALTINVAGIGNQCSIEDADAWACPEIAKIGTVQIETPLLPYPVNGTVYMAKTKMAGGSLPDMLLQLGAPVNMQIRGVNQFVNINQIQSTFAALPDFPYDAMRMHLLGGATGILKARTGATCGLGTSQFASHSGQSASGTVPITGLWSCGDVNGSGTCDAPKVSLKSKGARKPAGKRKTTALTVSVPEGCSGFKGLRVSYPKGTKVNKKLLKYNKKQKATRKNLNNVTGKSGSKKLRVSDFKAVSGGLQIKPALPGALSVSINTKNSVIALPAKALCGTLKKGKSYKKQLKKCQGKTLSMKLTWKRADGSSGSYTYKFKAGLKTLR